ncbi:MAG: DNA-binding MarR family transcriptional regulator [Myxococcota bacterium]
MLLPIHPDLAWLLTDQIGHAHSVFLEMAGEALRPLDTSVSEFIALAILTGFPEGLTQTDWGTFQGVTRQRAHTIAKRLLDLGLVSIEKRGRASSVTVTPAGVALVTLEQPALSQAAAANMGSLTSTEAEQLSRLLDKLLDGQPRGDWGPIG